MVTVSLLCLNKIKWNKIFLIEYHITNWLQFSPSSVCWLNHVLQMRSFVIGKENQLNVYDHVKTSVFQPANISCQNESIPVINCTEEVGDTQRKIFTKHKTLSQKSEVWLLNICAFGSSKRRKKRKRYRRKKCPIIKKGFSHGTLQIHRIFLCHFNLP